MRINYVEKGSALHDAIVKAGFWLRDRNGTWESSDDVAVQAIIDAFDPVAHYQAVKIAEAKAEAQKRIFAIYPQWKQANMTARAVELQDIWRDVGEWTAQEQAESTALKAAWDAVNAIRTASDLIEADLAAMTDWQTILAFDVQTSEHWP